MAVQGIGLNELKAICGPLCPTWVKFTEYDDVRFNAMTLEPALFDSSPHLLICAVPSPLSLVACPCSIPGPYSPSSFRAQADWVTRMLSELWPHINKATSQVVRETMEPILEANRPSIVSSMTFHKFELGKDREKAPHIEGIKLHKTGAEEDQVIMDLLIYWQSDASIILNIKTAAVTLQVQVKNLVFQATLRLIFQLGEQMPCIDAVVASLLRKLLNVPLTTSLHLSFLLLRTAPRPKVDFVLKAVGGSLAAIPGLEKQIDNTVASVLESVILWPERIVVKLNPAFDEKLLEMKLLEMKYEGELVVTVVRAEGVKNVDTLGKSDPYTTIWLNPKHMAKTGVCKNNLNPQWNETFLLPVDDPHTAELTIKVEDDDVMQDSDLGWALFPLADLMDKSEPYQVTLDLLPRLHDDKLLGKDHKLGRITLLLAYRDYSDEERDSVTAAEKAREPRIKDHSVPADQATAAMAAAAADSERRVREAAERALMTPKTPRASMARRSSQVGQKSIKVVEQSQTSSSDATDDALPVSVAPGAPAAAADATPAAAAAAVPDAGADAAAAAEAAAPAPAPRAMPSLARSMGDLKHRDREGALQVSLDQEAADSAAAAAATAAAEAEGDAPLSPALSPGADGKPKRRSGAMGFMSKVGQIGRNVKSGIEGSLSPKEHH
ncbi:unnamed protein product [Closterium sp. NIES-65]|nr:unnamed protein product [Closterium sp. NIES-65]